jgi:hypothetical protein
MFPPRLIFLLVFLFTVVRATANTFVVANVNDSGPGSLRQAITNANAQPNGSGPDLISFAILGDGVHTITLTSALPDITEAVLIDGWTQPGFNGAPLIELTATPGLTADGLRITGGAVIIHGLVINGFRYGIYANNGNNTVQGCYIGTNSTATQVAPNDYGIFSDQTSNNLIGGTTALQRNVISGNRFNGIHFPSPPNSSIQSSGNVIQGNYVGTDVSGTQPLPNSTAAGSTGLAGIFLISNNAKIGGLEPGAGNLVSGNAADGVSVTGYDILFAGNKVGVAISGKTALGNAGRGLFFASRGGTIGGTSPGAGNLISGNGGQGIHVESTENTIQGNIVGTDISGKIAVPNGSAGIAIGGGDHHLIGGSAPGAANLVSGNLGPGIALFEIDVFLVNRLFPLPVTNAIIQGNFIGTDVTGSSMLGNAGDGISLNGTSSTQIGGSFSTARNVISGNLGNGITVIASSFTTDNRIQGNLIGVAADGRTPLGNQQNGILLPASGGGTSLVGSAAGPSLTTSNTIAFNLRNGISVGGAIHPQGPEAQRISANSIHDNGQLGIDLGDDGVTPNDSGDGDTGANGLQNFPVLDAAFGFNGNLTVYGHFNSVPSKSFTSEFYANQAADSLGFGEGQVCLGQATVTTDASGNAAFNVTFPLPANVVTVSATAIDSDGNTSEFSASSNISSTAPTTPPTGSTAVTLSTRASQVLNISTRLRVETGDNVLIGGFIISGTAAKKIIVRAIGPSLATFNVPGPLADPVLELYDSSGLIARNDNWRQDQEAEIKNSGLAPTNDFEAAIVRTVPAGNYTAIVRGQNNGTGVALVEMFDLAQQADSRLGNVSTRGFVGTGDNVMIGGFIAGGGGGGTTTVLIRALGPSLAAFGVSNPLGDPTFELYNANGTFIGGNNDWGPNNSGDYEVRATGLGPPYAVESAYLSDVAPGNYTVILRGRSNATGVGLLEIYNLR